MNLEDLKEGAFIYIMKVNSDPMRIYDCIVKEVRVNPKYGVTALYVGKVKILLPDGTIKIFYTQLRTIDIGKYVLFDDRLVREDDKKEKYFISIDRNKLIDNYINNSQDAIQTWEKNISNFQKLIDIEKDRIEYLNKQRYD